MCEESQHAEEAWRAPRIGKDDIGWKWVSVQERQVADVQKILDLGLNIIHLKQNAPSWIRTTRIKEIKEEISTVTRQITFKDRRVEAAAGDKNFKLCDQLTEEISTLQRSRRSLELELRGLKKKEKKAKDYRKKSASPFSPISSDESTTISSNSNGGLGQSPAPSSTETVLPGDDTDQGDLKQSQQIPSDSDTSRE